MSRNWRKEMLEKVKTPLIYKYGSIYDAEGFELASMNRSESAVIDPVYRDELAKELVKRFNEYKGD